LLTSVLACTSAPQSSSSFTISAYPLSAASIRAVEPFYSNTYGQIR
jgi:hypothetical protein